MELELLDITIDIKLDNFNTLKITSTILGYVSGLFLKGKLGSLNIKYNHLLIEGQSGSGKSQTMENVISPLLCIDKNVLNSGECTSHALYRAASSSNFVPLILDEYKPQKIGKYKVDLISNIMRNSYDSHKVIKGLPSMKNREFVSRASVILCGEVGVEETANIERSLKLVFSSANHNEDRLQCMKFLKSNPTLLGKLGRSLLNGGMKMSEEKLKSLYDSIYLKLSGKEIKNERIKNSITNCMLGIALLKSVYDDLELNFEETTGVKIIDVLSSIKEAAFVDLLDSNNSSKGVIEESLETMNRMAVNRLLERSYDYDAVIDGDGDFVLRLNYIAFYDRFLKYCKEHNITHEVLPLASFKNQLKTLNFCKCYNKSTGFLIREGRKGERKTFRAGILNADVLKGKGIDIDYMLDSET